VLDLSSPFFDPLRRAIERVPIDPLPDADALQRALGERIAPLAFEAQLGRRGRRAVDADALYEVRIAKHGRIPTRANVHDLMNALVWATFPQSKRVLAERQYTALVAQVGEHPRRLPNARTRERDVLAMIDEGGVIFAEDAAIVFGHAILEHLATREAAVRGFPIRLTTSPRDVDAALAEALTVLDPATPRASVRVTRTSASIDAD